MKIKTTIITLAALCLLLLDAGAASAQSGADDYRNDFLGQFTYSTDRIYALAEAMPEENYSWSPDGVAMHVSKVYLHIARYNFLLPQMVLGVEIPDDIDTGDSMEEITDKEEVLRLLERSIDHVKETIPTVSTEKLEGTVTIYGQTVTGVGGLFQLETHMSEHIGQSIAYARMLGITPPWSQ